MNIDDLSALVATILAISLATERVVTIFKTSFPTWFSDESRTAAQSADPRLDRWRRLRVLAVAITSSWAAAATMAKGGFDWLGVIPLGATGGSLPVPLLGLLATGGSAFWSNVVGLTSSAKDAKTRPRMVVEQVMAAVEKPLLTTAETRAVTLAESLPIPGGTELVERVLRAPQPPADIAVPDVLRNLTSENGRQRS